MFPFLVFNRIIKDNSGRISRAQTKKSSFDRIQTICNTMTKKELLKASYELRDTHTITNPRMKEMLKHVSVFGRQQPLSNEEKIDARDKIKRRYWS